ncbi:MAG: dockerin type I repeat-containing protein, partial [Muribaculaceae bacterium]|nr:dockerin type I repeat-containing protein [Muribaculaceae bacterium]
NTTTNVFDLIASYKYYQPGQAWLEVPEANNASTIQIDQLYQGEELKHGDVNRDGDVNVSDVTALINMILGNIPKDEEVADVNEDTQINVSDVTALINIILGNI